MNNYNIKTMQSNYKCTSNNRPQKNSYLLHFSNVCVREIKKIIINYNELTAAEERVIIHKGTEKTFFRRI